MESGCFKRLNALQSLERNWHRLVEPSPYFISSMVLILALLLLIGDTINEHNRWLTCTRLVKKIDLHMIVIDC